MCDRQCLAADEQPVVRLAATKWQFPETADGERRTVLSGKSVPGGHRGKKCPHRTEFAISGTYYEEVLMHGQIFSGLWPEV